MFLGIASGIWYLIIFILIGAGAILYAIFGGAYYISTMFDHPDNCSCTQCQGKRLRALQKYRERTNSRRYDTGSWWIDDKKKQPLMGGEWKSTLELRPGMRIVYQEHVYRVAGVHPNRFGFNVQLVNEPSGAVSWVPIRGERAGRRIWLVRPSRKRQ